MKTGAALRTIALVEALKGLLALVVALGAHALLHRDIGALLEEASRHLHLNPAHHHPGIYASLAADLGNARLGWLALGASGYAAGRFVEAYGIWRLRAWAEWFAIASAAIYVPFEIAELARAVTPFALGALLVNLTVVIVVVRGLRQARTPP